jgi:pSer/pThr/pTyr-binding forkhead associated (FHA) protein
VAELSLEVVEGPDAGRRIDLVGPVEIGRQEGVGMVLQDQLVSRRHARVTPVEGGASVEDLGSRNGTFVNGNEIPGPTLATPGDQILVGVSVLQLRSAAQIAERPSAVRAVPAGLASPERPPDYLPPDLRTAGQPPVGQPAGPGGPAASPVGRKPEVPIPELDPLLDVHTKRRALLAPLAVFVVAALAVIVFLASR